MYCKCLNLVLELLNTAPYHQGRTFKEFLGGFEPLGDRLFNIIDRLLKYAQKHDAPFRACV